MGRWRASTAVLLPAALVALLLVVAWLQYRWTGEIGRAEEQRMKASLNASVRGFSEDVERELGAMLRSFHVERDSDLPRAVQQWNEEAHDPGLVEAVYFVAFERGGERSLKKVDEETGLAAVPWPEELVAVRSRIRVRRFRGERPRPGPFFALLDSDPPVVWLPVLGPRTGRRRFQIRGVTLLVLSFDTLREQLLPDLAHRYFGGGDGPDYDVVVTGSDGEVVYSTPGADVDAVVSAPDAAARLFSFRPFGARPTPRWAPRRGDRAPPEGGRWRLLVRHREGSLEEAVTRARTRNLAVSFAVMSLLAVSVVLIAVSARRATELGNRKMEFVAGVSHELRTPLAVIRSAGQNLEDGSVSEPEQVRRYGALIESEGRRLDELLGQVLELAGIHSGRRRFRREPVSPRRVVEAALNDAGPLLEEKGVELKTAVEDNNASVIGDAEALRRAVRNLIVNAVKHGGEDNSVDVRLERAGDAEVGISVSDRGPGIPDEDLPHLFDAFYRGSRARERQISGSGLGLSLVQHIVREHGGRIEVHSNPGTGSRFRILLPAARF